MAIVGLDKYSSRIADMLNSTGESWQVLVNYGSNGWLISCRDYAQTPVVDIWRTARLVTEFANKMLNDEWNETFEYEVRETYIEVYAKE